MDSRRRIFPPKRPDAQSSRALINLAHAHQNAVTKEPSPWNLKNVVNKINSPSNKVHEDSFWLLEASNVLNIGGLYGLSAEVALEALEIGKIETYDQWYIHIKSLLQAGKGNIDARHQNGEILIGGLLRAAHYQTLEDMLPFHKLVTQESHTGNLAAVQRAITSQRGLLKSIRILTPYGSNVSEIRGYAQELTAMACLLSPGVVQRGYKVIPSASWYDYGIDLSSTYTTDKKELTGYDMRLYTPDGNYIKVQIKSTNYFGRAPYAEDIVVIYLNEILRNFSNYFRIKNIDVDDFWQITSDNFNPKEKDELLGYFGQIILDIIVKKSSKPKHSYKN